VKPSEYRSLAEMITHQAGARPSATALIVGQREISYSELAARSTRVAAALVDAGIQPGDRVGLLTKNSAPFFECLFGALLAGAVASPLNWRLTGAELTYLLDDLGPSVLFYEAEFADVIDRLRDQIEATLICLDDGYQAWLSAAPDGDVSVARAPGDTAIQIYTSGTTGKPKGVLLSNASFLRFCLDDPAVPLWWQVLPSDVVVVALPNFHVGGLETALRILFGGGTAIVHREFDAAAMVEAIAVHRPTLLALVPTALAIMLRLPGAAEVDFTCIRVFFYGASPIPADLLREALARMECDFVQVYGMTEVNSSVVALPPEDHHDTAAPRLRSAGKPLAHVELAIAGSTGERLAPGQVGEILIRCPYTMTGYWNRHEATADTMDADGWVHTGDAGYLDEDGYLYIADRIKDMIVSGGENVYPAEVESVMFGHPDVSEVAVIGVPHQIWGEAVKAFVVLEQGREFDEAAMISWTRERIAGYKAPKSIEAVAFLPRNPTGKLLKHEIRKSLGLSSQVAR
jgi:acyl-CoA synthetase (AMP-forming)/AMP-acid ligase II